MKPDADIIDRIDDYVQHHKLDKPGACLLLEEARDEIAKLREEVNEYVSAQPTI